MFENVLSYDDPADLHDLYEDYLDFGEYSATVNEIAMPIPSRKQMREVLQSHLKELMSTTQAQLLRGKSTRFCISLRGQSSIE